MDLKDMQVYMSIYNQDCPFRGHPKSNGYSTYTYRDSGMHERFLLRLGVNCGPFVRTMPSLRFEKYYLSYLPDVAPDSFFAMSESHIYSKFQSNTLKIQVYGKMQTSKKDVEQNIEVLVYNTFLSSSLFPFP